MRRQPDVGVAHPGGARDDERARQHRRRRARDASGQVSDEHEGDTKVFWEGQQTRIQLITLGGRPHEGVVFLDDNGEEVTEDECHVSNRSSRGAGVR